MFAYCNNDPVNLRDSGGTYPVSYCNGDRNPLFIGYYGFGGGGGGGGGYSGGGNSKYKDIFEELGAMKEEAEDAIVTVAEECWDAYMFSCNQQQESQLQQSLAQQQLFENAYDYVTDDEFWSTDIGIVTQSTIVGALVGAGRGLVRGVRSGFVVFLCTASAPAALAVAGASVAEGIVSGAVDGFIGGLVIITIW